MTWCWRSFFLITITWFSSDVGTLFLESFVLAGLSDVDNLSVFQCFKKALDRLTCLLRPNTKPFSFSSKNSSASSILFSIIWIFSVSVTLVGRSAFYRSPMYRFLSHWILFTAKLDWMILFIALNDAIHGSRSNLSSISSRKSTKKQFNVIGTLKIHNKYTEPYSRITWIFSGIWTEWAGEAIHHECMKYWKRYKMNNIDLKISPRLLESPIIDFSLRHI